MEMQRIFWEVYRLLLIGNYRLLSVLPVVRMSEKEY
jgi:hypothetical protein